MSVGALLLALAIGTIGVFAFTRRGRRAAFRAGRDSARAVRESWRESALPRAPAERAAVRDARTPPGEGTSPRAFATDEFGPVLARMMLDHRIPAEVVRAKYLAYALALQATGKKSAWNDEMEQQARDIGALSEDEIRAAKVDLRQAIRNRVKVALVIEGWT